MRQRRRTSPSPPSSVFDRATTTLPRPTAPLPATGMNRALDSQTSGRQAQIRTEGAVRTSSTILPADGLWIRGRVGMAAAKLSIPSQRAVAQLGSALVWGTRGRRFKSCQPDQRTPGQSRSARAGSNFWGPHTARHVLRKTGTTENGVVRHVCGCFRMYSGIRAYGGTSRSEGDGRQRFAEACYVRGLEHIIVALAEQL